MRIRILIGIWLALAIEWIDVKNTKTGPLGVLFGFTLFQLVWNWTDVVNLFRKKEKDGEEEVE